MPKLPNYTAKVESAGAGGGRRAVAADLHVGLDVGDGLARAGMALLAQTEEQESRQALVASAEIRAKYAKALDDAALSGAPLEPLREQMAAELSKVGENFQTKQGADVATLDTTRALATFDATVNDINVRRAGAEARAGAERILNSEAAQLALSPSYLPQAVENVRAYVDTFARRLSPETRTALMDEQTKRLNAAAAHAAIRLNPEEGAKALEENKWDVAPERRLELQGYARQQIEYKRIAAERDRALEDRAKHEADMKARDGYIQAVFRGDLSAKLRTGILDDPKLLPQSREHLLLLMKAQAKEAASAERKSDLATVQNYWTEINTGKLFSPKPIIDSLTAGKLNLRDADYLMRLQRDYRDGTGQGFRNRLAQEIGRQQTSLRADIVLNGTEEGREMSKQIVAEMIAEVEVKAEEMRGRGPKGENPDTLLDPNSKDYFFTKGKVAEIKARVAGKAMQDAVRAATEKGAPRVTGLKDPALTKLNVGDPFIDENGNLRKMTPAIKKKIMESRVEFPVVPSGETPDKIARREAEARGQKYQEWNSLGNMIDTAAQ